MKQTFFIILLHIFVVSQMLADVSNEYWLNYVATSGTPGYNTSEDYTKLLDNDVSTKWCTEFVNESTIYIEFDATSPIKPIGYVLTTADDTNFNPGRNPKSWIIKGRNNSNDNWTILTVVDDGNMPTGSFAPQTFTLNINTSYRYFRFEVTSLVSGTVFQLSEFCFLMNDNNNKRWPNYLATSGTSGVDMSEDYPKLFDNDTSTKWCVDPVNGIVYVEFDATSLIKPTGYILTTGNDTYYNPGRNPKSWIIKGKKSTSGNWTTLATIDNGNMPTGNLVSKTYELDSNSSYRYFRFEVTSLVSGTIFQLSEFCLLVNEINDNPPEEDASVLVLGSNGNSPLFADCPLDSIFIGRNISYSTSSDKGYSPFYRNTSLRSVHISDVETEISPNEFYGCTNMKNVRIGDGVTIIGDWAFSGCGSLEYFSFGSSVETIGKEAFSNCTAMTTLISKAETPPTCDSQALDDINKWECMLLVPDGFVEAYQAAPQWKEFFFIDIDPDSINDVMVDEGEDEGICYDAQGRMIGKPQKGLNIIRYSDGTARKVLVK